MAWTDGPLVVYHGTDNAAASSIFKNGIELSLSQPFTDFGAGFYTTTSLPQAQNWADERCRRIRINSRVTTGSAVVKFHIE